MRIATALQMYFSALDSASSFGHRPSPLRIEMLGLPCGDVSLLHAGQNHYSSYSVVSDSPASVIPQTGGPDPLWRLRILPSYAVLRAVAGFNQGRWQYLLCR